MTKGFAGTIEEKVSFKHRSEENWRLPYRRQFLLGSLFWAEQFPHWKKTPFGNDVWLATHPDLNVVEARNGGLRACLLGFLLDPDHPERRDEEILARMLDVPSPKSVLGSADRLGGRWALWVSDGDESILFSDPAGYRQICYTDVERIPELVCASQPGLLAKGLNLTESPEARSFRESVFPNKAQYWWPGDTTPYREIHHLPPNHFLDLRTGKRTRFWPNSPLLRRSLSVATEAAVPLLLGILKAAHCRFPLAVSLTAGRDSRLNLAATRGIREKVFYFTQQYWNLTKKSPDIRIPSRLLMRLGLEHHLLSCPEKMSSGFECLYSRNVEYARTVYGPLAQSLRENLPIGSVLVKGNLISVGKGNYIKRALEKGIDPENPKPEEIPMISLLGKNHPFARKAYEEWLRGAQDLHGVELLDLLLWEDREGRWQGMSHLEWDLVVETLVPFNCRAFLEIMLSVDLSERVGPDYLFHENLIRTLWPETLHEPFNPKDFSSRNVRLFFMRALHQFMRKNGLYRFFPEYAKDLARRFLRFRS